MICSNCNNSTIENANYCHHCGYNISVSSNNTIINPTNFKNECKSIIDRTFDSVIVAYLDGRVLYMNKACEKLFGYTLDELPDSYLHSIVITDEYLNTFQSELETGFPTLLNNINQILLKNKDGREFVAEYSLTKINLMNVWYYVCVLRDITKRKNLEIEIINEKKNLEEAVQKRTSELTKSLKDLEKEIQEKQKGEKDIAELNKKIEFILGVTKTGLDIIDSNFNIRYIDKEWKNKYSDVDTKKCFEVFQGRTEVCPGCGVVKALETKQEVSSEKVLVNENNRFIKVVSIPFQEENGEWLVAEINVDITDLKKTEQQLIESKKELQAIYDGIFDSILIVDSESMEFVFANPYSCKMFGYSKEEFYTIKLSEIHPIDTFLEISDSLYKQQHYNEKRYSQDIPVLDKNKNLFYVDISTSLIDYHGKTCLINFLRDSTKRITIERELKESQKQLKAILDNIPDIAWLKDTESKYILVNEALCKAFGKSLEDFIGKTDFDFSPPELAEKYMTDDIDVLKEGKRIIIEEPWVDKDGNLYIIETIKTPIYNEQGKPMATTGIARDVTSRKKIEEELNNKNKMLAEKTKRLEELNKIKNEFLGMATHDLRNPLNTIYTTSSFLLLSQTEAFSEDQIKIINLIKTNTQNLIDLVNNLLDFAAIETDMFLIHKRKVDLKEFVNLQKLPSIINKQKNIQIVLELENNLPMLKLEPTRFNQVLDNLINNAIKYSNEGTTITLKIYRQADNIYISVIDEGIGIPENELHKLFKPFSKTSSEPTHNEKSTGLGLAIAKRIIELHNGNITVQSIPGKGSTFTVILPVDSD
jgi:PAS domain S-box-containing protein